MGVSKHASTWDWKPGVARTTNLAYAELCNSILSSQNFFFFSIGSFSSPGVTAAFLSHFPEHQRSVFTWKHTTEHVVKETALWQKPSPWHNPPSPTGPSNRFRNHPTNPWQGPLYSSNPAHPFWTADHTLGAWSFFPLLSTLEIYYFSQSPLPHRKASQSPPLSLMFAWGCPQCLPKATPLPKIYCHQTPRGPCLNSHLFACLH